MLLFQNFFHINHESKLYQVDIEMELPHQKKNSSANIYNHKKKKKKVHFPKRKYSLYPTASHTDESPKIRTHILRTLHITNKGIKNEEISVNFS